MLKKLLSQGSAAAAVLLSSAVRPRYAPPVLLPDAEAAAKRLDERYQTAHAEGYIATRSLIASGIPAGHARKTISLNEMIRNIRSVRERFDSMAATGDPDAIAAVLVDLFCIAVQEMHRLDNRRRVVAVWSALVTPSVVMREAEKRPVTLEGLVDAAADWMRYGYTHDARKCYRSRKTRYYAAHPARSYQLVCDAAACAGLDHEALMRSMIEPVLLPIGNHQGAVAAIDDVEKTRKGKG